MNCHGRSIVVCSEGMSGPTTLHRMAMPGPTRSTKRSVGVLLGGVSIEKALETAQSRYDALYEKHFWG